MICRSAFFFLFYDTGLLLRSDNDLYGRFFKLVHTDKCFAFARRKKCSFIKEICKIGARKSACTLCKNRKINIRFERLVTCVNLDYFLTPLDIGIVDCNLSVKTSGSEKRRVENIGSVCRRHDNNAVIYAESVHFNKQLVESLFAFVVTATQTGASVTSDSIDLINENDARSGLLCRFEKVTDTRCTYTYIHFNEIRTRDREERNARFACDRLCKQSFSGTRRADKQNTARYFGAEFLEFFGILQKFNNLLKLFLFFISTCYIGKQHFVFFIRTELCSRLAERIHSSADAAAHIAVCPRSTLDERPPEDD